MNIQKEERVEDSLELLMEVSNKCLLREKYKILNLLKR